MDNIVMYRQIIQDVLGRYRDVPYAYGAITNETIFDTLADRYSVLSVSWDGVRRIRGCLIHIDIIAGKVWVQRDGTEHGMANELVAAGIPQEHIVLGFHTPDVRPYTEFAVS